MRLDHSSNDHSPTYRSKDGSFTDHSSNDHSATYHTSHDHSSNRKKREGRGAGGPRGNEVEKQEAVGSQGNKVDREEQGGSNGNERVQWGEEEAGGCNGKQREDQVAHLEPLGRDQAGQHDQLAQRPEFPINLTLWSPNRQR